MCTQKLKYAHHVFLLSLQYSLIYNLTPDKRGTYRAARTNFLFMLLLLVTLFLFLIPVGYAFSG